jgi:hypothetical protein
VLRADVAVEEAQPVDLLHGVAGLGEILDSLAVEGRAARLDEEVESVAVDQFHDEALFALFRQAEVEGLDDILVAERGADGTFEGPVEADEAGLEVGGLLLVEDLQTDGAAAVPIAGLENRRPPAPAGPAPQLDARADVIPLQLRALRLPFPPPPKSDPNQPKTPTAFSRTEY